MIQAYLVMSHNSVYYLFGADSEEMNNGKAWTAFYVGMMIVILIWPAFMAAFLIINR